jgi:peptidyl-Asp metalloendopeptidase
MMTPSASGYGEARVLGGERTPKFAMLGLLTALISSASLAHAQQPAFVAVVNGATLTPQQNKVLSGIKSLPTTEEATVVRLNADALRSSDKISIPLESKSVSIQNSSRQSQGGNTIWSGAAPNESNGSTTIVANKQNVTGSIQTEDGSYRIWPLGDGLHALVKLNTNKFPPEHPSSSQ